MIKKKKNLGRTLSVGANTLKIKHLDVIQNNHDNPSVLVNQWKVFNAEPKHFPFFGSFTTTNDSTLLDKLLKSCCFTLVRCTTSRKRHETQDYKKTKLLQMEQMKTKRCKKITKIQEETKETTQND